MSYLRAIAQRHEAGSGGGTASRQRSRGGSTAHTEANASLSTQRRMIDLIDSSPRMAAQRQVMQRVAVAQRWPGIQSDSGNPNYQLGVQFAQRHVAASENAASNKAWNLYDPDHRPGSHSAYVTVIYPDLSQVTDGTDITPRGGYDWSLQIDVDAVCVGPTGRRNDRGDPGAEESISTVIVSGYTLGGGGRLITHVSTSQ